MHPAWAPDALASPSPPSGLQSLRNIDYGITVVFSGAQGNRFRSAAHQYLFLLGDWCG
jgi:hypothetical protein